MDGMERFRSSCMYCGGRRMHSYLGTSHGYQVRQLIVVSALVETVAYKQLGAIPDSDVT
jgi:hypothetical protein